MPDFNTARLVTRPYETPPYEPGTPEVPAVPGVPNGGALAWTHIENDPMTIGPAALQTARLGAWDALDPSMRARQIRAFVLMTLQAATLKSEPAQLGVLAARSYPDDEHNAAGAAVARSLLLLAP